ncbi:hypothetical protein [Bosea sp. 117]|uniref:hypothetical protein n=1 Tax=Bosea sp. 117 TaxID=1125973 RepID=UPI0004941937|nr:hypothetical protein [Bosea sp. 117]
MCTGFAAHHEERRTPGSRNGHRIFFERMTWQYSRRRHAGQQKGHAAALMEQKEGARPVGTQPAAAVGPSAARKQFGGNGIAVPAERLVL